MGDLVNSPPGPERERFWVEEVIPIVARAIGAHRLGAHDASDAGQVALCVLIEKSTAGTPDEDLRRQASAVTTNVVRMLLRRRRRASLRFVEDGHVHGADSCPGLEPGDLQQQVLAAEELREALLSRARREFSGRMLAVAEQWLRFLGTAPEIAAGLGESVHAVRRYLTRVRETVRKWGRPGQW